MKTTNIAEYSEERFYGRSVTIWIADSSQLPSEDKNDLVEYVREHKGSDLAPREYALALLDRMPMVSKVQVLRGQAGVVVKRESSNMTLPQALPA